MRHVRAQAVADGHVLTRRTTPLLSGSFVVAFDDERAALAAARECRSTAFVAVVSAGDAGRWILRLRRKNLFPEDERDRYASRVRRLVDPHGGRYESFDPDARELRPTGHHDERAST